MDAEASKNHLSLVIQTFGDRDYYMITNVYAPQLLEDKLRLLTSLEELRETHSVIPWIMGGDFNMIRSLMEKKAGPEYYAKTPLPSRTS